MEKGIEHLFHIEFNIEDGLVIDHLSAQEESDRRRTGSQKDDETPRSETSFNQIEESARSSSSTKLEPRNNKSKNKGNIS